MQLFCQHAAGGVLELCMGVAHLLTANACCVLLQVW
jgi:hypothetical protein